MRIAGAVALRTPPYGLASTVGIGEFASLERYERPTREQQHAV